MSRISSTTLLIIVILAVVFFVFGLLQFFIRCVMKRPSFSSISQSNRFPDASDSHTFQGQLQQLFRLHDSGLDQAVIDALPVFYYKEIMGLKEPFDCAVCLSEFSDHDKLKLLINCSHAFHIHCIETWLMSNSTCPLCRSLICSESTPMRKSLSDFDDSISRHGAEISQENDCRAPARIFSVRLGKFGKLSEGIESGDRNQNVGSSSSVDARRCYSMGASQYIVGDAELQVTVCSSNEDRMNADTRYKNEQLAQNGDKISLRSRGDSLSISKIWLWSKKGKYIHSSDVNDCCYSA